VRIDEGARAVTRRIAVPGRPTRLAADKKAVWVATLGKPAVWRIDTRTGKVAARIPLAAIPSRITLGEGSVWVAAYRRRTGRSYLGGTVIRIDPVTNRVVARVALGDLGPDGILAAHGLVWVAVTPG
jgi:DNA-binding beta-propeller fold protein YncE